RRTVGALPGLGERGVQGRDVLVVTVRGAPGDPLHVPAVRLVPRADVLRLGDVRVVLDRNAVVVVDDDQVAQLLVPGERGDLVAHALLVAAVPAERVA